MKKYLRTGKKALSVFMAVMMVMTAWVFFEPMKAEAAAGSYYVRVTWYCKDKADDYDCAYTGKGSGQDNNVGISVLYKENNGTSSTTKDKYWDLQTRMGAGSGITYTQTATITGFPVELYAYNNNGGITDAGVMEIQKLEVGSSSSNLTTIWQGNAHLDSTMNGKSIYITPAGDSGSSDSTQTVSTTSKNWVYPYASSITVTANKTSVTCPKTASDSAVAVKVTASATDQYGVTMFDPTWKISGSSKSTGLSVSPATSSASTTASVTSSANIAGTTDSQTATVTATWSTPNSTGNTSKTGTATFTVNDATYTATFTNLKDSSGNALSNTSASYKYGHTPTAASTATTYSLGDNDYTFKAWSPVIGQITADTTYSATYSDPIFVKADYDAVESAKQAVADFKAADDEYDLRYTQASRTAVESAINSVVPDLGRTQQTVVDGYAEAITNALEALKTSINVYDVIFLDENNTILKYETDVVYGSPVAAPADPDMYFDGTNHYTFSSWDSTEYDYVQDDLIVKPVFTEEAHTYTTETVDSTCTTKGCTKHTCTVCGYSYTDGETDYGAHSFASEYTVDLEPTCTTAGSKSRHCTVCDAQTDITEIPATGHDFDVDNDGIDDETVLTAATCLGQGVSTKTCEKCGVVANVIHQANGHDYDETVVAPTCVAKGYTLHTCKDCGYSYTDNFVDKIDHVYVPNTDESKDADCVHDGAEVSYCSVCGSKDVTIIPATGHDWDTTGVVTVEPTCDTIGAKEYTCKNDSAHTYSEIIPAKGHNYDTNNDGVVTEADGVETTAPGCVTTGVRTYTCANDSTHTYIEIIPASGHAWETEFTTDLEPT